MSKPAVRMETREAKANGDLMAEMGHMGTMDHTQDPMMDHMAVNNGADHNSGDLSNGQRAEDGKTSLKLCHPHLYLQEETLVQQLLQLKLHLEPQPQLPELPPSLPQALPPLSQPTLLNDLCEIILINQFLFIT